MTFFRFEDVRQGEEQLIAVFSAMNGLDVAYGDELSPDMVSDEIAHWERAGETAFTAEIPFFAEQKEEFLKAQRAIQRKPVAKM